MILANCLNQMISYARALMLDNRKIAAGQENFRVNGMLCVKDGSATGNLLTDFYLATDKKKDISSTTSYK